MSRKLRKYTNEFKEEAIKLALQSPSIIKTAPNQKWCGDISYVWTDEGWMYLAVVIDLYSRAVVG